MPPTYIPRSHICDFPGCGDPVSAGVMCAVHQNVRIGNYVDAEEES